jgi:hypothetical protein
MKKLTKLAVTALSILFLASLTNNPLMAQKEGSKGNPIPENVSKIAQKTCVKCHAEPGNAMALSHVNLTKWAEYSPEKQAEKAEKMCNMVTKGKMPPKNFRKEHPDVLPTPEEVKTICDWSQSLQAAEKK